MKTKEVSQLLKVDATPPSPIGSVSVGISPDVRPGKDHVAVLDAEQVKHADLILVKRNKQNPQKWVVKKCGTQVGELDQLRLKTIVLHDNHDSESI